MSSNSMPLLGSCLSQLGQFVFHTTWDNYLDEALQVGRLDPELAYVQDERMIFFGGRRVIWLCTEKGMPRAVQMRNVDLLPPDGATSKKLIKIPTAQLLNCELDVDREDYCTKAALLKYPSQSSNGSSLTSEAFLKVVGDTGFFVSYSPIQIQRSFEIPWPKS